MEANRQDSNTGRHDQVTSTVAKGTENKRNETHIAKSVALVARRPVNATNRQRPSLVAANLRTIEHIRASV